MTSYYNSPHKIINKDGKRIDDFCNSKDWGPQICFSDYNRTQWTGDKTIIIQIPKNDDNSIYYCYAFTTEQIKYVVDCFFQLGFKSILEENDKEYLITIKESDYKCKVHVKVFIDFIRALWEKDINIVFKYFFFKKMESLNPEEFFKRIQIISWCYYTSVGHNLPSAQDVYTHKSINYYICTVEQVMDHKNFKDEQSTHSLWRKCANKDYINSCMKELEEIKKDFEKEKNNFWGINFRNQS
jgi:hypothetical protein